MPPRCSIVFPAFNEEKTIVQAIEETSRVFRKHGTSFEIIVVDDASTDKTATHTKNLLEHHRELHLLRLQTNVGKGGAIAHGVLHATGDFILFLDCDLSVSPTQALRSLSHLEHADVLIGSRRVPGARIDVPQIWWRTNLGRVFNTIIRHVLHLPYEDTQCGFKAFRRDTARHLFSNLHCTRWAFDLEVILRARKAQMRIIEVPVEWRAGKTSRVRFWHGIRLIQDILYLRKHFSSW